MDDDIAVYTFTDTLYVYVYKAGCIAGAMALKLAP